MILAHGTLGFVVFATETWMETRSPSPQEIVDKVVELLQKP